VNTGAKLSPDDLAETIETIEAAREYLQEDPVCRPIDCPARDFAKALGQIAAACVVGLPCDRHAGEVHGQEAEELRAGIEQILRNTDDVRPEDAASVLASVRKSLIFLLERVGERDSRAFRETISAVIGTEA
jgi:hypothetical protein